MKTMRRTFKKRNTMGKEDRTSEALLNEHHEGCLGHENPSMQNSLNTDQEQDLGQTELRNLAAVLDVTHDAVQEGPNIVDGLRGETWPDLKDKDPGNLRRGSIRLIRASVCKHFPKLPADRDVNLEKHLLNVQETLTTELLRLAPVMRAKRLLGHLIGLYHCQTFEHLHDLLQHATSTKKAFVLLAWVLDTYMSQELLGHPDLQDKDLKKPVDLLLLTDWLLQAQEKLLANMQEDICRSLDNILHNEISERDTDDSADEEALVRLHVDVIQCINAKLERAHEMSPTLMDRVRKVCFQELQKFVKKYISVQKKTLEKQAKKAEPGVTHFLKTLNTCKELKLYVQTNGKGITVHVETVSALENMEALAMKLLLDNLFDVAEKCLKKYFKTDDKQLFDLMSIIKEQFHQPLLFGDVQKRVMDEAYKHISHVYLQHLVRSNRKKLKTNWVDDVGIRVTQDAELLHSTFSNLSPDVQQWNLMLLKVQELLECGSIDTLKLTVAEMLAECSQAGCGPDLKLLPVLLQWKRGLSAAEVEEVLDACLPNYPDRPRPVVWYRWLFCC